jgi:hypothetical protein
MTLNPFSSSQIVLRCVGAHGRVPWSLRSVLPASQRPLRLLSTHPLVTFWITFLSPNSICPKTSQISPATANLICFRVKLSVKYRHPNPFTHISKMSVCSPNVSQKRQFFPYFKCHLPRPPISCLVACLSPWPSNPIRHFQFVIRH